MNQQTQLRTKPIPQLIVGLSVPAILSMLVSSLNTAIDRIFVARGIGTAALSGVTVSNGVVLILQGFSLLIAAGGAAAIAMKFGRNDQAGAERIVGNANTLAVLISLFLTAIGLLVLKPLLSLYGASADNISFAYQYSTVIIGGTIPFILAQTNNNLLKGMGYAKQSLFNFTISILVNIILDPIFIFVFGWGVHGAALATIIGYLSSTILSIRFLCSKKSAVNLRFENLKLDPIAVKTIVKIAIPACLTQISLSFLALTFNHVAQRIGGNTAVAAYGIVYSMIMLVYMPIMGLGQGIQPILGYNFGAEDYNRVSQTLKKALFYVTVFCCFMFCIIEVFSQPIAAVFGGRTNPELTELTRHGLRLFCLSMPVVGIDMIGANYFQYIGKYKESLLLSTLRQLILLIPLVWFLPRIWGLNGMWIATSVADCVVFLVTVWYIRNEIALNGDRSGVT